MRSRLRRDRRKTEFTLQVKETIEFWLQRSTFWKGSRNKIQMRMQWINQLRIGGGEDRLIEWRASHKGKRYAGLSSSIDDALKAIEEKTGVL
jgi:hypothetical protein